MYYNGSFSDWKRWESGTPQGSVLSPTLFNYMLQDIPLDSNIKSYIYADDITVSATANTVDDARKNIEGYLRKLVDWTKKWGLIISTEKTNMQYFTKKKINYIRVRMLGQTIRYVNEHRLLGMILDSPKLNWRMHVKNLIRDCRLRLDILKSVSSPVWGASAQLIRTFYISYIRTKIDYGCIFYDTAGPILQKLDTIQNSALRLITGARKTSPILSLQVEAFIPSLKIHRGQCIIKKYLDLLHSVKNNHTARELGLDGGLNQTNCYPNSFNSRAKDWMEAFQLANIKRVPVPMVSPIEPWYDIKDLINYESNVIIRNNNEFLEYLNQNYINFNTTFTDGSKIKNPISVASAMYVPKDNVVRCWRVREEHSVVASELYAIYRALHWTKSQSQNFILFTDSTAALQIIASHTPKTYIDIVYKIQLLLKYIKNTRKVKLHWVRAHKNITGNEVADSAAAKGHQNDRTEVFKLSLSEIVGIMKRNVHTFWENDWIFSTAATGKGLHLKSLRDLPLIKDKLVFRLLNRREQVLLQRFRIGHVGVQAYLNRFKITGSPLCAEPICQEEEVEETLEHYIFRCPAYTAHREEMFNVLNTMGVHNTNLKVLLGLSDNVINVEIVRIFIKYVVNTGKHNTL